MNGLLTQFVSVVTVVSYINKVFGNFVFVYSEAQVSHLLAQQAKHET